MTRFLKGNYEALSRLGGSICFVSKKGFLWRGDGAGGNNACG